MSHDLEEELRHRLNARVAGVDLAPGAVATAAHRGRRRMRRRQTITGGGLALVVVAMGLVAVAGWDRSASDSVTVTTDGQTPAAVSETSARVPQLITREADDPFQSLYANLDGILVLTTNNCVAVDVVRPTGTSRVGIVWAHGWSAGTQDGKAVVYDASGAIFAREGDRVGLGGGSGNSDYNASKYGAHPCWTDHMWIANDSAPRPVANR